MDISHGMDVAAVKDVASKLGAEASSLEGVRGRVDVLVGQIGVEWRGPDSGLFVTRWRLKDRGSLVGLVKDLQELARAAQKNAGDQEKTSNTLDGGTGSTGTNGPASGGRQPAYTRDTPATEQQLAEIDQRLRVLDSQKAAQHLPASYAYATEWAARLKAGNPSSVEVEAFTRYCYLMAAAHISRGDVSTAATIAVDSFQDATSSTIQMGVSMVGLVTHGAAPTSVLGGVKDVAVDVAEGYVTDVSADGAAQLQSALERRDPQGIVDLYDRRSDDLISGLGPQAEATTDLYKQLPPGQTMMSSVETLSGRVEEVRLNQLAADSTDYMTGDGSLADKVLRGTAKLVPVVNVALTGAEVIGNGAHATMAEQVGQKALVVACTDSYSELESLSRQYGLAD